MASRYEQQLAPRDATGTLPFADPDAFGGQVADGLGALGGVASQAAIQNRARETRERRDLAASDASVSFAQLQEDFTEYALKLQEETPEGGAGYAETAERWLDEKTGEFLGGITDEKVRQSMRGRIASWRASEAGNADVWEAGKRVAKGMSDLQVLVDIRANRASRGGTESYAEELAQWKADIAAADHIPEHAKPSIEKKGVIQIAANWIGAQPPEDRVNLLDSGQFDVLPSEVVKQLRNGAEVDLRRQKIEAEAEARAQRAAVVSAIDGVLRDLGNGATLPDAEMSALEEQARAVGADRQADNIRKARIQNGINTQFGGATPVQIEQELSRVRERIAKAGDQVPADLAIRRDALESLLGARTDAIDNDPEGFAADNGIRWEPLDGSASTVSRRIDAGQATAQAAGRPVRYLTGEEVEQYRANMGTASGQRDAVKLARLFASQDPRAGAAVMRQLAPDDPMMLHLVGLTDHYSALALEGRAVIKSGTYKTPANFREMFRARTGPALSGMSAQARGAIYDTTEALLAYFQDNAGGSGGEVSEGAMTRAIDLALGSTDQATGQSGQGRGGIAIWRDGIRFALPANMTSREFGRRVANARPKGMFWSDGKTPVTPKQLLQDFYPVRQAGTRYAWRHRNGGWAVGADGSPAQLDIARLPLPSAPQRKTPAATRSTKAQTKAAGGYGAMTGNVPDSPYAGVRYGGGD